MNITTDLNKTIDSLEQRGHEAYIVGGAVRDMLLELPVRDYDICTSASVREMKKIFPKTTDIGGEFGTLLVHQGSHSFEVSQFKSGLVGEETSIVTDLKYRDFSLNAIAMKRDGSLIDPFHGREAIEKRLIQLVNHDPERLNEDPLRLLRAVRLALRLDFRIEAETESFLKEYASLIKEPAKERIAGELEKMFDGSLTRKQVLYLLTHPVIKEIPFLFPKGKEIIEGIKILDDSFHLQGPIEGWTMTAFSYDEQESKATLKTYKCSKQRMKTVLTIVKEVNVSKEDGQLTDEQLYLLKKPGIQAACKLLSVLLGKKLPLKEYEERFRQLPIHGRHDLAITGSNLIEWFPKKAKSGSWIGHTLKEIEKKVVLRQVANNKEKIYEWVKKESSS